RQARFPRTVEDVCLRELDLAGAPVQRDAERQPGSLLLQLRHLRGKRRRRSAGREPLYVDAIPLDAAVKKRRFRRVHHRPGAADEPGVNGLGIVDQMLDGLIASFAIEHAVEQVDISLLVAEEMVELKPAEIAVLERSQLLQED